MVDFVMRYLVEGTPKLGSDGGRHLGWKRCWLPITSSLPHMSYLVILRQRMYWSPKTWNG